MITEKFIRDLKRRIVFGEGPEDCWIWVGTVRGSGYGQLSIGEKSHPAHRVVYEVLGKKAIPQGKHLARVCENRDCVNPEHMRVLGRGKKIRVSSPFGSENGAKAVIKINTKSIEERFWEKIKKCGECWLWHGSSKLQIRYQGKVTRARYIALKLTGKSGRGRKKPVCGNSNCLNPHHFLIEGQFHENR